MAIRIPKLFKSSDTPGSSGSFAKPLMIGTPIWVEQDPNYLNVAFDIGLQYPKVIVVEYKKRVDSLNEPYDGYSRIYIVGKDGNPVPFMSNMWQELHNSQNEIGRGIDNYRIDSEGRFTFCGDILAAKDANLAIGDLYQMYPKWSRFPTAKDYATAEALCEAQIAIDRLKGEESHQWIANQIKSSQEAIKQEQERIAELEKNLNKIYENAADAMNLFDEVGIKPDMDGDGEEKTKIDVVCNMDFNSMYPGQTLTFGTKFIGPATILTSGDDTQVLFPGGKTPPNLKIGDCVLGNVGDKFAVYMGMGEWKSYSTH